jgi:hypothetical protein
MGNGAPHRAPAEYYWGTLVPIAEPAILTPDPVVAGSAEERLDVGRAEGAPLRSKAVWAASSIQDATAIAAIRSYSRTVPVPHEAIHVYRADLRPFHLGPVAIIEELRVRLETGAGNLERLARQYWERSGMWHIQEFIAPSLTILKEVPAATERDIYIRRWVQYNLDRERAAAL